MNSLLDLRFVIGLFFMIVGALLIIFSFTAESEAAVINRWCGIVLGSFGLFMFLLSFRKDASDEVLEDVQGSKNDQATSR